MRSIAFQLILFFTILHHFVVRAQDIGSISKDTKPLKISGTVSANQILYGAIGIANRRAPYNYFLSGNLNISLYGFSIPISYTFSNQQSRFQQPFNQYGIQPTYKWVKTYLGFNTMTFSPYSLNGHIFLGAGVELTPKGLFRCSAMYGRLQKAVEEDTNAAYNIPMYQRMGYGLKLGIGKGNNFIDLNIFHAQDQINSLSKVPEKSEVLPQENLVLGINFSKDIHQRIRFSGEYANSAFTRDTRAEKSSSDSPGLYKYTSSIFTPRNSSSYYNAFRTNLSYIISHFSFGIGYERIDPNYRTLGAYYFNNDLQNITFQISKKLFKEKLQLSANIGTQKNNLNEQKISTMNRFIGAISVNFCPSPKLIFSGNYSNFQTYTRMRTAIEKLNQVSPYDNLDTLNFIQLTQSANLNSTYHIGNLQNQKKRQNLNINISYQVAGESYANRKISAGTVFYNTNLSYSYFLVPRNLTLNLGLNTNLSKIQSSNTLLLGPTLGANKTAWENKLRSSFSLSWNKTIQEQVRGSDILNLRFSQSYIHQKKHNFNLSLFLLHRSSSATIKSFQEYTLTLGYSYSF